MRMKTALPKPIVSLFVTAIILVGALIIITLINYNIAKKLMLESLENEGVNTAFSIESTVRAANVNGKMDLQPFLNKYNIKEHVAFIVVMDQSGKIIASRGRDYRTTEQDGERVKQVGVSQQVALTKKNSLKGLIYEIVVPLHLGKIDRNAKLDGSIHREQQYEGKFHILAIGIYAAYGEKWTQPALVQMMLVGIIASVFCVIGYFQYKTLFQFLQLQEDTKLNEKLIAVGNVSAGIAHEIKNPLVAIKGFSQLLAEGKSPPEEESEYIRIILKESSRLERFLTQLLDYTKSRKKHYNLINLKEAILNTLKLVEDQVLKKNIKIETYFDHDGVIIKGDKDAWQQVLLNILLNSIQAMPQKGLITISTRKVKSNIVIEIQDTGQGLQAGTEETIFQPFFTTKNKGVGLGLALSRQIVEEHGGTIIARNGSECGTIIVIKLPRM